MVSMLFCMHKSTGEVLDPCRLCNSGHKEALLWMHKTTDEVLGPMETSNSSSNCFGTKRQVRSGTHWDCYSGPEVAVLHAQNEWWRLEPLWSWYSCADTLLYENHRCLGPIQTLSGPKDAVLKAQNYTWMLDPYRLVILVQITLFCKHKTTGEVWDP